MLAVFLLSFDTLRISSRATGTNQATFFLTLGLLCSVRDRVRWAGVCYGLAAGTAYFVAPVLLCLLAYGVVSAPQRRDRWGLVISFAAALLAGHVPAWLMAPREWWEQAVAFHFAKPAIGSDFSATFRQFMTAEGSQALACLLIGLWLLADRQRRRDAWLPLAGLAAILAGTAMGRVYVYYWFPSFPLLALGTALFLREAWLLARRADNRVTALVAALAFMCAAVQPAFYAAQSRPPTNTGPLEFHPTPVVRAINPVIAPLLCRQAPSWLPLPGLVRALRRENRAWWDTDALVAAVTNNVGPAETLYGDSTTTPLLALLACRRIAGELADTNTMQFRTGQRTLRGDLQGALADRLRLVVVQPQRGIYILPEFREFLQAQTRPLLKDNDGSSPVWLFVLPTETTATR